MVRMQSDARLPQADRLGYKHIGDALFRIAKEEGLRTYWRGATPTGKVTDAGVVGEQLDSVDTHTFLTVSLVFIFSF